MNQDNSDDSFSVKTDVSDKMLPILRKNTSGTVVFNLQNNIGGSSITPNQPKNVAFKSSSRNIDSKNELASQRSIQSASGHKKNKTISSFKFNNNEGKESKDK